MATTDVAGFKRDTVTGALAVTDPRIQTLRVDAGVITASATVDIPITWPVPFADANYTVVAAIHDAAGTANNSALRQLQGTKTASGISVRVAAGTAGYTAGQLFINAIAIHD